MSNVVESVEASFKSLVAEKPYRSITVKEVCERAFISRRTFYANFIDKRAIVAYLFRRDAVSPVERAMELVSANELRAVAPIVCERFYQGVKDEQEFYQNLVKPMAGVDPTFELVVARAVNGFLTRAASEAYPHIDERSLKRTAYYHASAQAIFLERWIAEGMEESPRELGAFLADMLLATFEPLVKNTLL